MTLVLVDIVLHESKPCGCGYIEGINVIVCRKHLGVEKMLDVKNAIALQNAEFDALTALALRWTALRATPVVDDNYPEQRYYYESALRTFISALKANGREFR